MKPDILNRFLLTQLLAAVFITSSAHAAIATKSGGGTNLTLAASWAGGSGPGFPTASDVATWTSNSLGAGLTAGSAVNWGSINITDAATNIAITGAGTITTGNITLAGIRTLSIGNTIALGGDSVYNITDATGSSAADATLSGAISGAFGITKSGAGTLTLSGSSSYTGATIVNAGTLNLPSSGALTSSISVGSSATLTGSGTTTGDITLNAGSNIIATGTVPIQGVNVTANATTNIYVTAAPTGLEAAVGVIKYTGTITGLGNFTPATNYRAGSITDTAGTVSLTYTGQAKLWNDAAGTWEIGTVSEWDGDTSFYWGDSVTFDSIITADRIVTLNGKLAPASVTVSNEANTYIFSGSGEITGPCSLTKSGAGSLVLGTANTYTGPTSISGGTLTLSGGDNRLATTGTVNFAAAGTLSIANNQTLANLNVANNTIGTVTGAGTLTLNGQTFQLGSATNNTTQTVNMSGLSGFVYNNSEGTFHVGGINLNGANNVSGELMLAQTSTITASQFNVGHGNGSSKVSGSADIGIVNLGQSSVINADSIGIGDGSHANGTLQFQTLTSPTLTIRGTAGGTSRANMIVGLNASSSGFFGKVDLITGVTTGSTLDAMIGTLTIGNNNRGGSYGAALGAAGSFFMGSGTLDVTSLLLGTDTAGTATSAGACTAMGTFTLGVTGGIAGGTVKAQTLTLGNKLSSTNDLVTGTFTLNNGGTLAAQTIQAGAFGGGTAPVRTLNWNDGTIKNYDASNDLAFGSGIAVNLAATGTHTVDIETGRAASVASVLAGANGTLVKAGAGTLTLSAANTYTGDTTVNGGTLALADNAQLAFTIGDNGVNNKITGTGTALLQGDFNLNLTGAVATTGNEWTLVDVGTLAETFDSTFTLVGFTKSGGVHTKVVPGSPTVTWTFTEATGKLTVSSGANYASWLAGLTFGPGADTSATGDPDGDGIRNLLEYVLGGDPRVSSSSILPSQAIIGANLVISYKRSDNSKNDTTQAGQWSTDLSTWTNVTPVLINDNGSAPDDMTITIPLSNAVNGKLFGRLTVTQSL